MKSDWTTHREYRFNVTVSLRAYSKKHQFIMKEKEFEVGIVATNASEAANRCQAIIDCEDLKLIGTKKHKRGTP